MKSISAPALAKWAFALALSAWVRIPALTAALGGFMILDLTSAVLADFAQKKVCAQCNRQLVSRLGATIVLITVAGIMDKNLGLSVGLVNVLSMGYLINEAICVVENCARAGAPVPLQLVQALSAVRQLKRATPEDLKKLEEK